MSSSIRLSPSTGGLGGRLASRIGPPLQRVCNTVEAADVDERATWGKPLRPNGAFDIGGRVAPTLKLALPVCCTQADLIMFRGRPSAAFWLKALEIKAYQGSLKITRGDEHYIKDSVLTAGTK